MWHTGAGEDWQFLPTNQGHQGINTADTGIYIISRIYSRYWIQWLSIDIHTLFRINFTQAINWLSTTIERSAKYFF